MTSYRGDRGNTGPHQRSSRSDKVAYAQSAWIWIGVTLISGLPAGNDDGLFFRTCQPWIQPEWV